MSFHKRAWNAAADEYGRQRAEQYGRYAKARAILGVLTISVIVILTIAAAHGAFGG
jgi:hypothetical protein